MSIDASRVLLALAIGTSLCGCRDEEERLKTYSVSGKVVVDGQPATRAEVTLHPLPKSDDKAVRPFAVVDPDGSFRLSTYEMCDGAPVGEYAVTVVWPGFTTDPLGEETPGPDRLRKRYADARRSAFRATIREGDNQLPPFELTAR